MNITEEKRYIYSMMEEISKERRRLTEAYEQVLNRLNQLEAQAPASPPSNGYGNWPTGTFSPPTPYGRQTPVVEKWDDQRDLLQKLEQEHQQALKAEKQRADELELQLERQKLRQAEIQTELNQPAVIQKRPVPRRRTVPFGEQVDGKIITEHIASILKEAGEPMGAEKIFDIVRERTNFNMSLQNFKTNMLPRAIKNHPSVERAMRGHYQYVDID